MVVSVATPGEFSGAPGPAAAPIGAVVTPSPANTSPAGAPSACRGGGSPTSSRKYSVSGSGWAIRLDSAKPPGSSSTWVAWAPSARSPRLRDRGGRNRHCDQVVGGEETHLGGAAPQIAGRSR